MNFIFFEKAKAIVVKTKRELSLNFVPFSEYMSFIKQSNPI